MSTALLLLATVSTGLGAGVYALYAHTIMPAIRTTDDRTFVAAFQALDRAIVNPWFIGGSFVGAPALAAAAALAGWGEAGFGWITAAFVAHLVVLVITVVVHVPVNDAVKAAGEPDLIDVAAVRAAFGEARWAAWNVVRVVASLGGFASLAWALVLRGRATA